MDNTLGVVSATGLLGAFGSFTPSRVKLREAHRFCFLSEKPQTLRSLKPTKESKLITARLHSRLAIAQDIAASNGLKLILL